MILAAAGTVHVSVWAFPILLIAGILTGMAAIVLTLKYRVLGFIIGIAIFLLLCGWIVAHFGIM